LPPSPRDAQHHRKLIPASRYQDATTSPSATGALVARAIASTASSAPRLVTIAKRPSSRAEDARKSARDLPVVTSETICGRLARRANQPDVIVNTNVKHYRHGRARPGHPRLYLLRKESKTWITGPSPVMTSALDCHGWLAMTTVLHRALQVIRKSATCARWHLMRMNRRVSLGAIFLVLAVDRNAGGGVQAAIGARFLL